MISRTRRWHKHILSSSPRQLFDEISQTVSHYLFPSLSRRNYQSLGFANRIHDQQAPLFTDLAKCGLYHQALISFRRLNNSGIKPTKFILCTLLNSCTKVLDLLLGSQIHARMIRTGYEDNLFLSSALVDLYAKCDTMGDARKVFDSMTERDHVSWTSIISGFTQNGYGREAMELFKEVLVSDVKPNCFTFASIISVCSQFTLEQCALLHALVLKLGVDSDRFVASSLIDCYSKCGKLDHAILLFDAIIDRDTILFNSIIVAYSQNLQGEEALKYFMVMRSSGLCPTEYTLSIILNACGSLTALPQGVQVHCLIAKVGSEQNVFVACSLVDMYSKSGCIDEARRIFDQQIYRNDVLWTSMITAYAQSGRGVEGLELFEQLVNKEERMKPSNICFTAVLTACNHAGLLNKAVHYFDKMWREYGLVPELDQYACMIDIYGKTGHLRKAKDLIEAMPFLPNAIMWTSILSSCKAHGDVELGREAADQLFKVEPHCAAHYVTLANIYAKAGMWGEVLEVRKMMRDKGFRKSIGWSWIEVEKRVHVFSAGDTSHCRSQDVYAGLNKLTLEMMEDVYPAV